MVSFQLALFLFVSMVSSAPTSGTCCTAKTVGNITYMLVESDKEDMTTVYGCKDGCVYEAEDVTGKFCFKDGERPVNCLDWGYKGDIGPSHWGKHYKECNNMSQSPIDIPYNRDSVVLEPSPPLSFQNYDKVRFSQFGNTEEHFQGDPTENGHRPQNVNNGHTAQLDVIPTISKDVGVLSGGPLDGNYQIDQLHFHWGENNTIGSEHTLNGTQYPMEMHIVHKKMSMNISEDLNITGGLAVTGFFFKVAGWENPAIEPLIKLLKNIIKPNTFVNVSGLTFKISDLVAGVAPIGNGTKSNYSSYDGSLTTPACLEIVKWINFIKPIEISSNQLAHFRTLKDVHDNDILKNYRPVQWLHGRNVTFYGA